MVVTLSISHVFKYPVDLVMKMYLNKNDGTNQQDPIKVDIIASYQEGEMTCLKRRLTMANYFPNFFRKIESLKRETVIVEEEVWSQPEESRYWVRSHDKTWDGVVIAHLAYVSRFEANPKWTLWEHNSVIDLGSFGIFGTVLELYLKRSLNNSIKSDIKLMETLMRSNVINS